MGFFEIFVKWLVLFWIWMFSHPLQRYSQDITHNLRLITCWDVVSNPFGLIGFSWTQFAVAIKEKGIKSNQSTKRNNYFRNKFIRKQIESLAVLLKLFNEINIHQNFRLAQIILFCSPFLTSSHIFDLTKLGVRNFRIFIFDFYSHFRSH